MDLLCQFDCICIVVHFTTQKAMIKPIYGRIGIWDKQKSLNENLSRNYQGSLSGQTKKLLGISKRPTKKPLGISKRPNQETFRDLLAAKPRNL
jgi:hypothetical protein